MDEVVENHLGAGLERRLGGECRKDAVWYKIRRETRIPTLI